MRPSARGCGPHAPHLRGIDLKGVQLLVGVHLRGVLLVRRLRRLHPCAAPAFTAAALLLALFLAVLALAVGPSGGPREIDVLHAGEGGDGAVAHRGRDAEPAAGRGHARGADGRVRQQRAQHSGVGRLHHEAVALQHQLHLRSWGEGARAGAGRHKRLGSSS